MSNYKCEATAYQVAEAIKNRTALDTVLDLSGADPVINVGTVAAGNQCSMIKVKDQRIGAADGWKALPGFGAVDQPVYTGTTFQIWYENNDGPALFHLGFDKLLQIIGDLVRRGGRVELWTSAHAAAPAFTTFVAAFEPNLYWPLQGRA